MEIVEPEVTVMDFGIDGCYAQYVAVIRNQFHIMCDWRGKNTNFNITTCVLLSDLYPHP